MVDREGHIPPGPWNYAPEFWDRLVLSNREWPGLATVEVSRSNKWDTKKAKGSHGGEREFSGADLAKVRISLRFWEAEDYYTIVSEFLPIVEPNPTKTKIDALSISHAACAARGVTQVTIDSIDGPKKAEPGIWAFDIDATEYRPPATKNAVGTAKGGKGAASPPCKILLVDLNQARASYAKNTQLAEQAAREFSFTAAAAYGSLALADQARIVSLSAQMSALKCTETPPSGSGGTDP